MKKLLTFVKITLCIILILICILKLVGLQYAIINNNTILLLTGVILTLGGCAEIFALKKLQQVDIIYIIAGIFSIIIAIIV